MPEKETMDRAKEDLREGKSPSTAAGEFVREEIEHVREGKHGARSPQQAIAIGLSKARSAGIPLEPPEQRQDQRRRRGRKRRRILKRGRRDPQTGEKNGGAAVRGSKAMKQRAEVFREPCGAVASGEERGPEAEERQRSLRSQINAVRSAWVSRCPWRSRPITRHDRCATRRRLMASERHGRGVAGASGRRCASSRASAAGDDAGGSGKRSQEAGREPSPARARRGARG